MFLQTILPSTQNSRAVRLHHAPEELPEWWREPTNLTIRVYPRRREISLNLSPTWQSGTMARLGSRTLIPWLPNTIALSRSFILGEDTALLALADECELLDHAIAGLRRFTIVAGLGDDVLVEAMWDDRYAVEMLSPPYQLGDIVRSRYTETTRDLVVAGMRYTSVGWDLYLAGQWVQAWQVRTVKNERQ